MPANVNPASPEQATLQLVSAEGTPLHFSGPPQSLTGSIPLVNTGTEKQKIRTIAVNPGKLKGAASLPIRDFPLYGRLYGGEQARVPATIVLDPQTPPGQYSFEIALGEKTAQATAHVSEVVDLRLDPKQITILAGAATVYTRTLIVENAGNVPLPTGAECQAPIFDSFDLVSSFLMGLHTADKHSAESMVKGFLGAWSDLQAGTLVTKRPVLVIRPGQKMAVDVEFHLPTDLKPLRHYRSSLQLYNATLAVDIYTTAKAGNGNGQHAILARSMKKMVSKKKGSRR